MTVLASRKKNVTVHVGFQQLSLFDLFESVTSVTASAAGPFLGTAETTVAVAAVVEILKWFFFPDEFIPTGERNRFNANVKAIEALKSGEEGREADLVRYVGWGGLANAFNKFNFNHWSQWIQNPDATYIDESVKRWGSLYGKGMIRLNELLTESERRDAENSTLTAYYTPPTLIKAIWNAVQRLGFRGGDVLEPAAGIGYFLGLMPEELVRKSKITAIEKDAISAGICQKLFPDATVINDGFENAPVEEGSFDLVISNVPFGQIPVFDPKHRDLSTFDIHNYFIGKSARLLREGGILAVVTSTGTMDSKNTRFREWLQDEGMMELAGAMRLPAGYFSAVAETEVSSDVLFFVKQTGITKRFSNSYVRTAIHKSTFDHSKEENETGYITQLSINEYFDRNPASILGEMVFASEVGGGMYRGDHVICHNPQPTQIDLQGVIDALPELAGQQIVKKVAPLAHSALKGEVKIKGRTYTKGMVAKKYDAIKAAYFALRMGIKEGAIAEQEQHRADLRTAYDDFLTYFGPLNKNTAIKFLGEYDYYFPLMQALEINRNNQWVKSDIFFKSIAQGAMPTGKADSDADAISLSVWLYGYLNVGKMAEWRKTSVAELTERLTATKNAFLIPGQPGRLELKEDYLSGNIHEKLEKANNAALNDDRFKMNVEALEAVAPMPIPFVLLSYTMSSSWLPPFIYSSFIQSVIKLPEFEVSYNPKSRLFEFRNRKFAHSVENRSLGSGEMTAVELVEKAANGRSINITKEITGPDGKPKRVKDNDATAAAISQQESLNELFVQYVHDNHQQEVETAYNVSFNYWVNRPYVAPLEAHYPGASTHINLYAHQKRAVERIKSQDTLLGHNVGSGKTFTMITGAMELKRLGLAQKPMIVVQNSTLLDFVNAFRTLYPAASLLFPQGQDMEKKGREVFLQSLVHNEMDAVIIPQSMFKLIPDELASLEEFINEEKERIEALLLTEEENNGRSFKRTVKKLNSLLASIDARRMEQACRKTDKILSFEELGVDALFIDEAHSNKRLGLITNRSRIKGIDTQGSQQAMSAMCKVRSIQNRGGRVVLATGTPISNTMAEAWTILRFIGPKRLKQSNIDTFDHFAGSFGQVIPSFELSPTGQFKAVERFAKFINVKMLTEIFRSHVDIVLNDDVLEFQKGDGKSRIPELKNGKFTSIQIEQTEGVQVELERIKETLRDFERMDGSQKQLFKHIPLVMFGQARKVTIDPRLLNPNLAVETDGKLVAVANEIYRVYVESAEYRGTQLVFSDVFQSPPAKRGVVEMFSEDGESEAPATVVADENAIRFNAFNELTRLLIERGIPAEEIAMTPEKADKREAVFAQVRTGAIRVIYGSTERMGVGVNVQERVAAIHHIDAPNRPTDFEQRNGRALRQGNILAEMGIPLEIFTYGVKKTMDATAYGRLAMKQKFINQLLKGQLSENSCSDISGEDEFAAMSFDEMMATLSGSQTALMYISQKLEMNRLVQAKKNHNRRLQEANHQVFMANRRLQMNQEVLPQMELEKELLDSKFGTPATVTTLEVRGQVFTEEFGKALKPIFETMYVKMRRFNAASDMIALNGLKVELKGFWDFDMNGQRRPYVEVVWGKSIKETVSVPGRIHLSFEQGCNGLLKEIKWKTNQINYDLKIVSEFSEIVETPFAHEETLADLKCRVAQLERQMEEESRLEENGPVSEEISDNEQPDLVLEAELTAELV